MCIRLYPAHIGYAKPQAEYIAIPKSVQDRISNVEQNKATLVLFVRQALSGSEQKAFQQSIALSSFIKQVTYTPNSIVVEMNTDSLGYIYTPSSPTLTLFYDSTAGSISNSNSRTAVYNKQVQDTTVMQSNRLIIKDKIEGRREAYISTGSETQRIAIAPFAGEEQVNEEQKKQEESTPIENPVTQQQVVVPRKIIPQGAQSTYIRGQIHTNSEASSLQINDVLPPSQTTGKQPINRGEPVQSEEEQAPKEKKISTPTQIIPPVQEETKTEAQQEETSTVSKEETSQTTNIQSVRGRIIPPSTQDMQQSSNGNTTEANIPIQSNEDNKNTQIEKPRPASENSALVVEKEEKKQIEDFSTQKSIVNSLLNRGEYEKALTLLQSMTEKVTSKPEKEELLYLIADVSEVLSRTKPEMIEEAINNFTVAMNFNLQSKNVPDALLQLGLLNGAMKNTKEMEAYFKIIRTKYPKNKNVPLTYYYLGKYYQDNKQYSKALVQYKTLEEQYPQFEFLREVIVSIIQCLDALQYYNDIKPYIAFIDGRWPTLYQVYPDILLAKAKVHFDLKEYATALDSYWQYVNIMPKAENIDMIYSRIGDSYLHLGEVEKARSVYKNIVQNYQGTEGYVLAKIRLAEDSIIDDITDDNQFLAVFDRSFTTATKDTYEEILKTYPQSAFAPIAKAKLALWYFWMKDYNEALRTIDSFTKEYPNNALTPSIHMLIGRTLDALAQDSKTRGEIPALWNKYSSLFTQEERLLPQYRLHIAQALASAGEDEEAIQTLQPFFQGRRYEQISEQAIKTALGIHKKMKNWKKIEDLYYRVLDWELPRDIYSQMVFETAMAFESMEEYDKAEKLFQRLFSSVFTAPYYRGISAYYIAKNGLRALQPPARMYPFAQESLNSLLLASKEKELDIPQETIRDDIIRALIQLRSISSELGSHEETLRYTILQEQYEPDNILLQIEKAKLVKEMGNNEEWRRILEGIIQKDPSSSYARLARMELVGEQNRNTLRELNK